MSSRAKPLLAAIVAGAVLGAGLLAAALVLLAGRLAHAATLMAKVSQCVVFLAQTRTLPLGLFVPTLLALSSAFYLVRAVRAYRHQQRLLAALPLEPVPAGQLGDVARTAQVDVFCTRASRPAAFCFGLLRPRIVFTSGLLDRLSDDEQVAAFWHEAEHARAREPLRFLVGQLAARTFFWLPMLRDLLDRYTLIRELDADRLATTQTSSAALAGALHEVVAAPSLAGAVGFADFAAARVDRLFDPAAPLPSLFKRTRVALSVGAVALLGLAFTSPAKVPVSKHVHSQPMMMKMPVLTQSGMRTELVPCAM